MSTIQMSNVVLRRNLNRDLTPAECDQNVENLKDFANSISQRLDVAVDDAGLPIIPDNGVLPRHLKYFGVEVANTTAPIDWAAGSFFKLYGQEGETTVTFSNVKDGQSISVLVVNSASPVNFPVTVQWAGGITPTGSDNEKIDLYQFTASEGTVYGQIAKDFGRDFVPPDAIFDYMYAEESKASGTNGDNAVLGRNLRKLVEVTDDAGNMTIDANGYITLRAGTYQAKIACTSYGGADNQAYLMRYVNDQTLNEGDDEVLLTGTSVMSFYADLTAMSHISGRFTIPDDDDPEKRKVYVGHWFAAAKTYGFGKQSGVGPYGKKEVYATAEFWRIA